MGKQTYNNYIYVVHSKVDDIKSLIRTLYSKKEYSVKDFLDFQKEGTGTNIDLIWNNYSEEEKKKYKNDYENKSLSIINPGTSIILRLEGLELFERIVEPTNSALKQIDFEAWYTQQQKDLIGDKTYYRAYDEVYLGGNSHVKYLPLRNRVYLYIRSKDILLNISPFILNLSTNKNLSTGSFSIDISPIYLDEYKSSVKNSIENQLNVGNSFSVDFFEESVQENDLIFIRYEYNGNDSGKTNSALPDGEDWIDDDRAFLPQASQILTDQENWDMIGLVDSINISTSSEAKSITISGSDLMKLFVQDTNFFIPIQYVLGQGRIINQSGTESNALFKRLSTGYENLWFSAYKSIYESIWFIVYHLSQLSIVSSDLFSGYGDSLAKKTVLNQNTGEAEETGESANGLWGIVKILHDPQLENRRLVASFLKDPNSSLIALINQVCQKPFVEIIGDTYGSEYDLIIRQPPFRKRDLDKIIDDELYVRIDTPSVVSTSLNFSQEAYSYYQVIPNTVYGSEDSLAIAECPIIYFSQIAEIYGCRKYTINDSYLYVNRSGDTLTINNIHETYANDILYLLETTLHLPFTRTGSITICGERRIRVGSYIYLEPTNELYYVTGVSQSCDSSNNRTTSLRVERGMYIGVLQDPVYNYFNLFNTSSVAQDIRSSFDGERASSKDIIMDTSNACNGLNERVFKHFVSRDFMKNIWNNEL